MLEKIGMWMAIPFLCYPPTSIALAIWIVTCHHLSHPGHRKGKEKPHP